MKPSRTGQHSILIVDDELSSIRRIEEVLSTHSLDCMATEDGYEALRLVEQHQFAVVLLDLRMERVDGMEILRQLVEFETPPRVIMLTGYGTIDLATRAMKLGAHDFLTKPVDFVQLIISIRDAFIDYGVRTPDAIAVIGEEPQIVGKSPSLLASLKLLDTAASADLPVLLIGETGTGKDLFARRLHQKGQRKHGKYLAFNCSTLPEQLIQSELFGHEKGAFTDADRSTVGLFEAASGGTLFLDEVDALPASAQTALLRTLDSGEIRPVGGTEMRTADVRLVAAAQRPLSEFTKAGEFRDDLYFRLRGLEVRIPPLRERLDDLPLLIEHFSRGRRLDISDEAMQTMVNHHWPGNVRELRQVVERAMVLSGGDAILPSHLLLSDLVTSSDKFAKMVPLAEMNREYILEVLRRHDGNIRAA
ncbi:MAG: sigma-54 dependent transcriptional regulator, partial [Planctomycetota bacterium]|nr:sigma-54 dependent transcriptional regulator [Planctomycetota bacterium]